MNKYIQPNIKVKTVTEEEELLAASPQFSDDNNSGSSTIGGGTYTGGPEENLSKQNSVWSDDAESGLE